MTGGLTEREATLLGRKLYGKFAKANALRILKKYGKGVSTTATSQSAQVSETVTVYGNRSEGSDPLLTLLESWLFWGDVDIGLPGHPGIRRPNPPAGGGSPVPPEEEDPCESMGDSIDSLMGTIEIEKDNISDFRKVLKKTDDDADRDALNAAIDAAKDNIKEAKDLIKDIEKTMKEEGC